MSEHKFREHLAFLPKIPQQIVGLLRAIWANHGTVLLISGLLTLAAACFVPGLFELLLQKQNIDWIRFPSGVLLSLFAVIVWARSRRKGLRIRTREISKDKWEIEVSGENVGDDLIERGLEAILPEAIERLSKPLETEDDSSDLEDN